ncbi:THAP domain-containing protein 3-like [Plodia interpunctella]|uniref:THAP domain-containing protein 3-like n=1 Tax=Plodia interpunctella TaxID=58824 RepID=UPI00236797FD|nr:THAP domain-containing protein 3-like [Plodia interpunctella]
MPKCSIVMCGASKNKKRPRLTLHRFPRNETLKIKWLEVIGEENINPRHKEWVVCSLHFEESCFNRTLDVIRLCDDSLPTIFPFPLRTRHDMSVLDENCNINIDVASTSTTNVSLPLPEVDNDVLKWLPARQELSVLGKKCNINNDVASMSTANVSLPVPLLDEVHKRVIKSEKIKALKQKCLNQQKKIKRLNEKLRRQAKKIANMKDIIEHLRQANKINMEQAIIIEDLAGSHDFIFIKSCDPAK